MKIFKKRSGIKLISQIKRVLPVLSMILVITISQSLNLTAQTNAPSIKTGVSFQWDGNQPNNSSPAVLQSITIDGNVFDQFAVPNGYEMTQLGPDGHSPNNIWKNGSKTISGSSGSAWDSKALDAFQDKNLNHYFEANPNGQNICNNFGAIPSTNAQKQTLFYNPGIPSNAGGFVAMTERGGNNCFHLAVYGTLPNSSTVQLIGETFVNNDGNYQGQVFGPPLGDSDYWRSGRTNENGQTIGIAIFRLSDVAPVGSTITKVQLTATTRDHGDGKFFIMQTYAANEHEQTPINTPLNEDAGKNDNVPAGSTYTVVSGPSNGSLNLNPDGTYTYTPNNGFTGPDSFEYKVCLPAPNSSICDQATVNILVLDPPTANDDNGSGIPGNAVTVPVLSNDVAGTGTLDPASVQIDGTINPGDPLTVSGEGQWTINPGTGAITFTPEAAFIGNPTPIQYTVSDDYDMTSNLATVTIIYLVGPNAEDDYATTTEETPVDIDVLDNDTEGDEALDPATVSFVAGTEPDASAEGVFTVDGTTGLVTFTPAAGFVGSATIDYQVCDLNTICDIATITVEVTAAITGPTANDDNTYTLFNTAVDIDALDNDVPGSAALDPATLTFVAGTEPDDATEGVFTVDNATGIVTFTPANNFIGTATIDYQICDLNANCDIATITVDVIVGASNLYPALGPGTLAFEDLWPAKGDYDFNDLVIDYQFEILSNPSNYVDQVIGSFTIQAFGASFENGFGFQLNENIDASDLSVTGYELTENIITLNANGTEAGQSKPTIIVFDNAFAQMPHPGVGIGVNTEPNAPYVSPVTLTITIDFEPDTYTINDVAISSFNPFLIVDKNRAVEVHLPNYPPTDLADQSMFGQWDDASDASTGKYYVSANNLPWAINIYEKFDWPIEKQDITWVHLKFAEWALSGGLSYPDWYKDLPGYRNSNLIYNPQ